MGALGGAPNVRQLYHPYVTRRRAIKDGSGPSIPAIRVIRGDVLRRVNGRRRYRYFVCHGVRGAFFLCAYCSLAVLVRFFVILRVLPRWFVRFCLSDVHGLAILCLQGRWRELIRLHCVFRDLINFRRLFRLTF